MTRVARVRPADSFLPVLLGLAISGCGPSMTQPDSPVLSESAPSADMKDFPQAYPRSQINDPRLSALAVEFRDWILQQRSAGPDPLPVFNRVEILPTTQTVLPYGVGSYEQEPRLPVILTTGPGWAALQSEAKEAIAARLFGELARRLEALAAKPPLRPTLTIQTPSGLELSWINDLVPGRKNLHGDEDLAGAASPWPASTPPPPTAVDRGTNRRGDQR